MITVTGDYVRHVASKSDDPAGQLRVLLVLAQQLVVASGGDTNASRDLFATMRRLVDQLASQAAAVHPTESNTPTRARAGAEHPAQQGGTGVRVRSWPH